MPPDLRRTVQRLPRSPGVYRFRDARGTVLYVGRATELRPRVASYWSKLRGRRHLARMVGQITRIEAIACASVHEATWLERNLLERSLPRWNRTRGGQETPVYLRLDSGLDSPGLTVAHARSVEPDVRCFGPYLGGERARLTVSALHRVLPLAHTGSRLRGAELDLARIRGVDGLDAPALARAMTAVLDREPDAVAGARSDLQRTRDRASTATAFELAGRIQAELAALEWTTDPQRVTVDGGTDAEVYGWCDGILVHLKVNSGRLDTWSQRACSGIRALPRLAGSPPEWAEFAHQAAELAAALNESSPGSGRFLTPLEGQNPA
jgi:excinuclease ABC subunit C